MFSQNIGASLEALYSETGHWQWTFWENVVLTPAMALLIWLGVPPQPIHRELLHRTDWAGIAFAGLGGRSAGRSNSISPIDGSATWAWKMPSRITLPFPVPANDTMHPADSV